MHRFKIMTHYYNSVAKEQINIVFGGEERRFPHVEFIKRLGFRLASITIDKQPCIVRYADFKKLKREINIAAGKQPESEDLVRISSEKQTLKTRKKGPI